MPLSLFAAYMLWSLYLMDKEFFIGKTGDGTNIYRASIGIYLALAASIINMVCIILSILELRKQKQPG